ENADLMDVLAAVDVGGQPPAAMMGPDAGFDFSAMPPAAPRQLDMSLFAVSEPAPQVPTSENPFETDSDLFSDFASAFITDDFDIG
ncbi:MAG: hypothetical protein AAFO88_02530, partial [Pseudomonadota bacterium]